MTGALTHGAFTKKLADHRRIERVPIESYNRLGEIEHAPLRGLVFGWMLGGVVRSPQAHEIDTPRGTVIVPQNHVWGSVASMREDILAAVGQDFPYHRIRYCLKTLRRDGLIHDCGLVHPETKGTYGKIYEVPYIKSDTHVDVVKAFRLYFYGDPNEFNLAEACVGDPREAGRRFRNKFVTANQWLNHVAEHGNDRPSFTNIGRWRSGEGRDAEAPVFVPWFTADIDRADLMEAYDDTRMLTELLEEAGVDLGRTFVSFSGRRGFHVQVSADQIGSPIFFNSEAAKVATSEFFTRIACDIELDPCTFDPRSLIRLSGSIHERTEQYKQTWVGDEFLNTRPETIFSDLRSHRSFSFPDPTIGKIEDDLMEEFGDAVERAASILAETRVSRQRSGKGRVGKVIGLIQKGITESENWHEYHTGRNKAGYIIACWLQEHPSYNAEEAKEKFYEWNQLNSPPMGERELERIWRNADRTINGSKKKYA